MREIDIWFGMDYGIGRRLEGELISLSEDESLATIKITDKDFLDDYSEFEKPLIESNIKKLYNTGFIRYDEYQWSYKGEVKLESLEGADYQFLYQ